MESEFNADCGPMAVRNTSWFPTSNRITDNLVAPVRMCMLPDGSPFLGVVVYPPTTVRYVKPGEWMVDALTAPILDANGVQVGTIDYPEEPVLRVDSRHMEAQEIDSTSGGISVKGFGGSIYSVLPKTLADAFPWWQGGQLFGFTVRAVLCPGRVVWHE